MNAFSASLPAKCVVTGLALDRLQRADAEASKEGTLAYQTAWQAPPHCLKVLPKLPSAYESRSFSLAAAVSLPPLSSSSEGQSKVVLLPRGRKAQKLVQAKGNWSAIFLRPSYLRGFEDGVQESF